MGIGKFWGWVGLKKPSPAAAYSRILHGLPFQNKKLKTNHDAMYDKNGYINKKKPKPPKLSCKDTNTVCNKKGTDNIIKLTEVQGIVRISL